MAPNLMADIEAIKQSFSLSEVPLIGELVGDVARTNHYFANVLLTLDSRGHRQPSHIKLQALKIDLLHKYGIEIEYLLIDSNALDLESGLRATLIFAFPDWVRNAFCSLLHGVAKVWIENKRTLQPTDKEAISACAKEYFGRAGFHLESLAVMSEENVPGKVAILSAVRQLAPAETGQLIDALRGRSLDVPSEDWLVRRLDALRKSGDIVQRSDRKYCLTVKALSALGSRKDKTSPDIGRMLALAKKKH